MTDDAVRTGGRRRVAVVAALLVAVLVAAGLGAAVALRLTSGDGIPRGGTEPGAGVPTPGTADPALGVFRETFPDRVEEFGTWLGRDVDLAVDYSSREQWQQIADPTYLLEAWAGADVRLVLGVAMLPTQDDTATIETGATGAYDAYFVELARRLVDAGRGDSVLRVGWEFNLPESRWSSEDPGAWIDYWRSIVAAMRSVPGQAFEFDWNPGNERLDPYDPVDYYPGDDVVDYVGVDVYDATGAAGTYPYPAGCDTACRSVRQTRAWDEHVYGGARGLRFWSGFAAARGKPMSLPEWGLWDRPDGTGGADDPMFVRRVHAFVTDPVNRVAYQAYFEFDGDDGRHRLMTSFPASGEVFRELFGGAGAQR